MKLIEGRNTGFPRVMKALEMNSSAPIRFEYDEQRKFLSVILPIHPSFRPDEPLLTKEEIYQNRILAILEQEPATLTEHSLAMNYKGITSNCADMSIG